MLSAVFVGLVAVEHIYIMILEMFLWDSPRGMKTFGLTKQQAESTRSMAANQGLYNGFLAAGLIWGLFYPDATIGWQIQMFFVGCVVVAALFGGATAKRSIWLTQGAPALIALLLLLFL
ncbi:DUF1304 domain-containing protein [Paenibacillus sp. JX-17]|uniref:DUF1304 domain-containing protein n=1 Tax=Paenibacillus lacisoli TaxID=3064525 RepID=A0ABT9CBR6_9BACL|nr:DUF1304 domain-containing protein [Paenibacillus sp. JX-17]MDO7906710.1 DUF1304 domain-containing protein [Paenibacillus sp. JX-17]